MSDDDNVIPKREHYNPSLDRWKGKAKLAPAYKRAPKQEKETKERLRGGRAIPASGAKFRKADVEVPDVARIECKATGAKSFSVTREMIRKVEEAAMLSNQVPFIEIEFVDSRGKVVDSACVLTRHALTNLVNRIADAKEASQDPAPSDGRGIKHSKPRVGRITPRQRS